MFRPMRRFKQEVTREECVKILTDEKRGVLAVNGDNGYPYAVPVNFYYDRNTDKIYFHCAKAGHKLDAMLSDDKVCFTTPVTRKKTGRSTSQASLFSEGQR